MVQTIESARTLYLDLLTKVLVNSIYEDPSADPWHGKQFDPAVRAVGRDWPRSAHTMVGLARLNNLRDLMLRTLDNGVPGDYIETGVWRGGCCILMKAVLEVCGDTKRNVYVADSFEGLPKPNPESFPADLSDTHFTHAELSVSLEAVKANFEKYNLLDPRVIFVKGLFQDTLPKLESGPFSLLRLDGDMYESTKASLDNLYPKLSPGGYIIIDDYGAVPACRQAVEDYRAEHHIADPMVTVDWTGIWWQKGVI